MQAVVDSNGGVKKHKVHLIIRKAIQIDTKKNEWCTSENFQKMYDLKIKD
jgi:hypothetical protein